jgi:hypothetical protein
MKFRLKNALIAALLSLGAITQSGCDCTTVNVLCDLVNTFLGTPSNTITVGQAFEVNCDITNLPGAGKCDVTGIANATLNLFEVFKDLGNGNWSSMASENYLQGELAPDAFNNWVENLTLNQTGSYRLDYYTDFASSVLERLEDNNLLDWLGGIFRTADQSQLEQWKAYLKTTNNYRCVYITVVPDAQGRTVIVGRPVVELGSPRIDTRVFEADGK